MKNFAISSPSPKTYYVIFHDFCQKYNRDLNDIFVNKQ